MSINPREIPEGAIRFNTDSSKMEVWIGDKWMQVAVSSPNLNGGARACFAGGQTSEDVNTIDFIAIATTGNASDFGDLTLASSSNGKKKNVSGCSNGHGGL